jgi:hypothetical protein
MRFELCPCGVYQKLITNTLCPECTSKGQKVKVSKAKPKKELPKVSDKQAKLNRDIRKTRQEVMKTGTCAGCGKREGGAVILEDSHLISRAYCNKYKRPDLYTDVRNRTPHCKTWLEHKGCHTKWESNAERHTLQDYQPNMAFIKKELPEVAKIMLMNEARSLAEKPSKKGKQGITTAK